MNLPSPSSLPGGVNYLTSDVESIKTEFVKLHIFYTKTIYGMTSSLIFYCYKKMGILI